MHFVSLRTCRGIFFCLIFRATVHKQFPYSNKTTTHVPSRLVTCAECRHTATPFVCPTIPRMKSNKCSSPWQPSYRSVLQFSLAPLSVPLFWFIFPWSSIASQEPRPGKMFYMAAVTNAAETVSSTSLVGLFLLSECAWPTRVTPLLISCRSYADGAVYAVVVLLSISNGVLYQVRTLHPIGNIVLYQVPRVNQPFN